MHVALRVRELQIGLIMGDEMKKKGEGVEMDEREQPEMSEEEEAFVYAMHLACSQIFPVVLNAAVELELFDIMAEAGPGAHISAAEIASKLPTARNHHAPSMLERMMDLLTSHSLLTCVLSSDQEKEDGELHSRHRRLRLYGLSPAGKFFAKKHPQGEGSLAPMLRFLNHPATKDLFMSHDGLKETVLGGGNLFENVYGTSVFEVMSKDSSLNSAFNKAMADYSVVLMKKVVEKYRGFEGLTSLVDVGGGSGAALRTIIAHYPSIRGLNFDLPQVLKEAPSYPGIEHVEGDMFVSIPKADAIMVKRVCHDWHDEECLKIFKNCYEALAKGGKVIVIEFLRPTPPESTSLGKFMSEMDNNMLMRTGGKERTLHEFQALCSASGFSDFRLICNAYALWVLEFYK